MMIVKVKSEEHAFTIPVPYTILRMGCGILTSNLVQRKMKEWLSYDRHAGGHSSVSREHGFDSDSSHIGNELLLSLLGSQSTKQALRQLIKELQRCKGTVLVNVHTQDGTKVLIKL
ncbi:hypothetical protein M6D81_24745 [Paenibacillus sp. J5C_2022]|uniref:hypothetical protein n=1 Tax=Paenibacillus sp. J5C2022 TaxID=2977129 RepID=UPI0021CEBDA9|nr:hypothetical protein [Paenibacillus sp. J5C2022]MCU6711915.1 hypothetical protein [Paenibacillus sp. J5C2022]